MKRGPILKNGKLAAQNAELRILLKALLINQNMHSLFTNVEP